MLKNQNIKRYKFALKRGLFSVCITTFARSSSFKMWWKLILSVMTVLLPQEHEDSKHLPEFAVDAPTFFNPNFVLTPHGPQSPEEEALLRKALSGQHFGGDMVLPKDLNTSDSGILDTRYRWPGFPGRAVVPFVLHRSIQHRANQVYAGMNLFKNTCITFKPRENERDYVMIHEGNGCQSAIGRNGGQQLLSLAPNCDSACIIAHELMHAVGCIHEHQRPDRDKYIWVYKQNALPAMLDNFDVTNAAYIEEVRPYDYDSMMHYGNYAFSSNGRMTMEAKNGQRLIEPYYRSSLSWKDIQMLNKFYRCG